MLTIRKPNGRYRTATPDEVFEAAAKLRSDLFARQRTPLTAPADVGCFLRDRLAHLPYEMFAVLFLDTRHRLIDYEELFRGTIDGATVYAREVMKRALHHNASAVVLGHNHPSGIAEPSEADRHITLKLSRAL